MNSLFECAKEMGLVTNTEPKPENWLTEADVDYFMNSGRRDFEEIEGKVDRNVLSLWIRKSLWSSFPEKIAPDALHQFKGLSVVAEIDRLLSYRNGECFIHVDEFFTEMRILQYEVLRFFRTTEFTATRLVRDAREIEIIMSTLLWSAMKGKRTGYHFAVLGSKFVTPATKYLQYIIERFGGVAVCTKFGDSIMQMDVGWGNEISTEEENVLAQYNHVISSGTHLVDLTDCACVFVDAVRDMMMEMTEIRYRAPKFFEVVFVYQHHRWKSGRSFSGWEQLRVLERAESRDHKADPVESQQSFIPLEEVMDLEENADFGGDGFSVEYGLKDFGDEFDREFLESQIMENEEKDSALQSLVGLYSETKLPVQVAMANHNREPLAVFPDSCSGNGMLQYVLEGDVNIPVPGVDRAVNAQLVDNHFRDYDMNVFVPSGEGLSRLSRPVRVVGPSSFIVLSPRVCDKLHVAQCLDSGKTHMCTLEERGVVVLPCGHTFLSADKLKGRDLESKGLPWRNRTGWFISIDRNCGGLYCDSARTVKLEFCTDKHYFLKATFPKKGKQCIPSATGNEVLNLKRLKLLYPFYCIRKCSSALAIHKVYLPTKKKFFLGFPSRQELKRALVDDT